MKIFKFFLLITILVTLLTACSFKFDQHTSDIILKVTARNVTYALLEYAPDLEQPMSIFLKAVQMALENNEQGAVELLEKEAWTYLTDRFHDKPMLLQDIQDLYALVHVETDLSMYVKYKAVVDGALSAVYIFENY